VSIPPKMLPLVARRGHHTHLRQQVQIIVGFPAFRDLPLIIEAEEIANRKLNFGIVAWNRFAIRRRETAREREGVQLGLIGRCRQPRQGFLREGHDEQFAFAILDECFAVRI